MPLTTDYSVSQEQKKRSHPQFKGKNMSKPILLLLGKEYHANLTRESVIANEKLRKNTAFLD